MIDSTEPTNTLSSSSTKIDPIAEELKRKQQKIEANKRSVEQACQELLGGEDKAPKTLKDFINLMDDNPSFRSIVLREAGLAKRPFGVYYKSVYGLQIKPTLDILLDMKQKGIKKPLKFAYRDYPKYKNKTLYLRIEQSIRFVIMEMDEPDQRYRLLRKEFDLVYEPDGVYIRWVDQIETRDGVLVPTIVEEGEDLPPVFIPKWREGLNNFLSRVDNSQAYLRIVVLKDSEVAELQQELDAISNIVAVVTNTKIKVVRFEEPPTTATNELQESIANTAFCRHSYREDSTVCEICGA